MQTVSSAKVSLRKAAKSLSLVLVMTAAFSAVAQAQIVIEDPIRDAEGNDRNGDRGNTPGYVRLRNLSYAGSGCPAGSVAANVSSSRDAFTLIYDSFYAETGPGVPLSQSRKNCQVNVDLDFPSGWQYSVFSVDSRGYVNLEPGVRAEVKSSFYFQGQSQTASLSTSFFGPTAREYHVRDTLGLSSQVWSPCGMQRSLNINYQVRLTSSGSRGRGLITMDSPVDGSNPQPFTLQWRRCR